MVFLGVLGVVIGVLVVSSLVLRWNEVRYRKKGLPPGTMGWPLFGETTDFLKHGPCFMKSRRLRYGRLFKTHILGCPTVVCMDADMNKYLLMSEGKGFVPGYPQSMLDILGTNNIAAVHGPLHKLMRGSMLGLIQPTQIREQLLPKIDEFMRSHLANWSGSLVDIQQKTKEMALLSSLKQIAGISAGPLSDALKAELYTLALGTISLPINLPGTNYSKGLQARKKIVGMLEEMITERRSSGHVHNDMLDGLLNSDNSGRAKLTNEQIIDLIITLIYSGYETMSTTSMMAVKYLSDHPKALEQLREKNLESHQHFMLFGGGGRLCPGKEVGTVEIATFLHYFVTHYRWEEAAKNTILKFPRVEAPNGLLIRVQDY